MKFPCERDAEYCVWYYLLKNMKSLKKMFHVMNILYTWEGLSSEKSLCASFGDVLGTLASFSHSLYPEYIHTQNLNKMSIWWHHQASAEDIHLYESKAISKNTEMLAQSFSCFYSYSLRTEENTKLLQVHKILLFVRLILVCCRLACLVGLQDKHLKCHKYVCCNKDFPFRSSPFCRFPGTQPAMLCIVVEKI